MIPVALDPLAADFAAFMAQTARPLAAAMAGLAAAQKGGPGSGNWGHRGRLGKVGGSARGRSGKTAGMIERPQGFRSADRTSAEANFYPHPTVYLDADATIEDPRAEVVGDWAWNLVQRAKQLFPFCKFDVSTGIHGDDYRVYAIIKIRSPNGQHEDALEWLLEHATK